MHVRVLKMELACGVIAKLTQDRRVLKGGGRRNMRGKGDKEGERGFGWSKSPAIDEKIKK